MIIPTHEEMITVNKLSQEVENAIDLIISSKRDIREATYILNKEETKKLAARNQRIYTIYLLFEIASEEEKQNVERILIYGRTLDESIRIYRILSLYLRRIEFDFPMEDKKEIVNFILFEKISVSAVLGVIKKNNSLRKKDYILNGFKEVLSDFTKS